MTVDASTYYHSKYYQYQLVAGVPRILDDVVKESLKINHFEPSQDVGR
jgi:hypothetical protein